MNPNMILAVVVAMFAFASGATAQLTDFFGADKAHLIASACSFVGGLLAVPLAFLQSQTNQVKNVAAMPGVDPMQVNTNASTALAKLALDDSVPKVQPKAGAEPELIRIAGE